MNSSKKYKVYTLVGLLGITVYALCITKSDNEGSLTSQIEPGQPVEQTKEKKVIPVSSFEEHEKYLKKNERVITKLYTKWCGPCKSFAPLYEEFAVKHPEIICLDVDAERVPSVRAKYNVNGFPSFILTKNGTKVGQFSAASKSVARFEERVQVLLDSPKKTVKAEQPVEQTKEVPTKQPAEPIKQCPTEQPIKRAQGEVISVASLEDLETHIAANNSVIIDVYASWCGPCKAFAPHYDAFAAKHPEYTCLKIDGDKATWRYNTKYKVSGYPTFIFMKKGTNVKQFPGAPRSAEELEKTAKALLG